MDVFAVFLGALACWTLLCINGALSNISDSLHRIADAKILQREKPVAEGTTGGCRFIEFADGRREYL